MVEGDIKNYKRISVVGSPGSGKTTLSFYISEKTGVKIYRMSDVINDYEKIKEFENWDSFFLKILSMDEWILDGYCEKSIPDRISKSELFIFLDIPFYICLKRVFIRGIKNMFLSDETVYKDYSVSFFSRLKYLFGFRIYKRVLCFWLKRRKKLVELIKKKNMNNVIVVKNKTELTELKKKFERI